MVHKTCLHWFVQQKVEQEQASPADTTNTAVLSEAKVRERNCA